MKHASGYGRYNDDPEHVGCPYAKGDMTPCMARDGSLAVYNAGKCVGCNHTPAHHLKELAEQGYIELGPDADQIKVEAQANALRDLVRRITEPVQNLNTQGQP